MANYLDFKMEIGEYGKTPEFKNSQALVLAIKNILLSKPGNFPFNPSVGMNIKKYQFDLLDNDTLSKIKTELSQNIASFIPDLDGVNINVGTVTENSHTYLYISIRVDMDGEISNANFVILNEDEVKIYNEVF